MNELSGSIVVQFWKLHMIPTIQRAFRHFGSPIGGSIIYVGVVIGYSLFLSRLSEIRGVDPIGKSERGIIELERTRLIMFKRHEMRHLILNDLIDDKIGLEDAAVEYRSICLVEPSSMGRICQVEQTKDEVAASRRSLLRGLKKLLDRQPEKCDQLLDRLTPENDRGRRIQGRTSGASSLIPTEIPIPQVAVGRHRIEKKNELSW